MWSNCDGRLGRARRCAFFPLDSLCSLKKSWLRFAQYSRQMFRQFVIFTLAASAVSLTACGGGEDFEEPMDQAFEIPSEPPERGVEWLAVTMEAPASGKI